MCDYVGPTLLRAAVARLAASHLARPVTPRRLLQHVAGLGRQLARTVSTTAAPIQLSS
jgi:hypothetical protein